MKHEYDVIVVGGGHAGTEAAAAAARCGSRTALVTQRVDRIGEMSCNPAIGCLGKGQIVREVDALDGVMGVAADAAGIQFRLLNRSRGPAAQGPRAQMDRALYRHAVQQELGRTPCLTIVEGEVEDLVIAGGAVRGVLTSGGSRIGARSVVLTTGTFLRGIVHLGEQSWPAGRFGDASVTRLAARLSDLGLPLGRLKTGTPPRLDARSIDWGRVGRQEGDADPVLMSFTSGGVTQAQVACGVTTTNPRTHDVIRTNIQRSALYGGRIEGVGPRYCPSIEDKVHRFADRDGHQVFLEPEGLGDPTVYPNGISTSLPADVQEAYVRTITGLDRAVIVRPGYAIEYDYVDPRSLDRTLMVLALPGLFLAGQINGTTGYEEAAGQGLVAGVNASNHARERRGIVFDRTRSFVGVMIDDLVTRGVSEPYRMFSSRAEFRLQLRADNADQRLTPFGASLGCVGEVRRAIFEEKSAGVAQAGAVAKHYVVTPSEAERGGLKVNRDGVRRSVFELLSYPSVSLDDVRRAFPDLAMEDKTSWEQVAREALYAPFISRQADEAERLRRDEDVVLPSGLSYAGLSGLSGEVREKLERVRPETLGQASRIEGMTPAALATVLLAARRFELSAGQTQ